MSNCTKDAFFELVRAGLWEKEARISRFNNIGFSEVYRLAQEQSVVGIVAAGLDHVIDLKFPKAISLQFVGDALLLEQRNKAMNEFIGALVDKMCAEDIYTILVKGQGIAQCYERPLWRSCGDVDLLLDEENYEKAKSYLLPLADSANIEGNYQKHLEMTIESWIVELHGSLRSAISARVDKVIDEAQKDVFGGSNVRVWLNGKTEVFLPSVDNDVIFIFTHYLKHFYKEGLGLKQICDWCRLLWVYRDILDSRVLELRIKKMGLMSEWRAFGAFAVEYLGMPAEAMPLYDSSKKWKCKASKICDFIMEVGNMGHNRDSSYFSKYPYLIRKVFSFGRRFSDFSRHATIFPLDSLRFFPYTVFNGFKSTIRGE